MLRSCRIAVVAAWASVLACAPSDSTDGAHDAGSDAALVVARATSNKPAAVRPFPKGTRTVELARSVAVHLEPRGESKRIGTIAKNIRVGWGRRVVGEGCDEPWVEIEPRGWVCGSYLEPSPKAEYSVELPRLRRGEVVPGVYGKVVTRGATTYARLDDIARGIVKRTLAGSVKVRRQREVEHEGERYWRIDGGEYLAASAIRELRPPTWGGARVGDATGRRLPIGFAYARRGAKHAVDVYDAARAGRVVRRLAPREVVSVHETTDARLRIGDGAWVDAADVRVAELTAPPPLTGADERWIDVDLDRQVLVAYEGERPVYATLISSGAKKYPSETGVFRVWVKFSETDMNGQMGDEAPYSVATVPWTQFYAKDLALHTSYWHDGFGEPRSHGCINLAPVDARFLYFWSEPSVPPGWSMAHGVVERPGSQVRVRSAAEPEPSFKGYAKRVYEARRAERSR